MVHDWFTRHAILTKKNAELEKMNTIVGAYSLGELKNFTSADTAEYEDENALRYPTEVQNTLSH